MPRPHLIVLALALLTLAPTTRDVDGDWRTDPAWDEGPAEWALYAATRPIYGVPRSYEATIFTNTQTMDPETGTKANDWRKPGQVPVFKHNVSEMIPTANYIYRFLTTSFVDREALEPFALTASTQEDCGTSFKRLVVDDGTVTAHQFDYFPNGGDSDDAYDAPANLAFHDMLSLTLRDYPFGADEKPTIALSLVPDQTDTHMTGLRPNDATVRYVERETLELPYGSVDAHHLRVEHAPDGGTTTTDYWFAADPEMRHVMVKYAGPYGVEYELKSLAWWAYWNSGQSRPE